MLTAVFQNAPIGWAKILICAKLTAKYLHRQKQSPGSNNLPALLKGDFGREMRQFVIAVIRHFVIGPFRHWSLAPLLAYPIVLLDILPSGRRPEKCARAATSSSAASGASSLNEILNWLSIFYSQRLFIAG
jgi:hypothetical protein